MEEKEDIANNHPEVIKEIEEIMKTEFVPHHRYPVGKKYTGKAIWQK